MGQFRLGDCTGVSQAACLKSVVNPSGPRKMTLNEENEDLLFCAEASRLALRGGGFACHSCSFPIAPRRILPHPEKIFFVNRSSKPPEFRGVASRALRERKMGNISGLHAC